ncbi:glyoxylate/hydroxypyruvate reductase A [Mesorhizobium sp. CAU 1732]|uniref:2-hydroxyacid dehydrogenase n=1 Tax=Mesorhizobium sp. CAU 1732 TaxID=3140358 RepID=UPI00326141DB
MKTGKIALVTRLSPEAETMWLERLSAVMPGEDIRSFVTLTPDEYVDIEIAIVANPDPAHLAQLTGLVWVQSLWAGVERLVAELGDFRPPIVRLVDPELARTMGEAALAWVLYLFRDMPIYAAQQRASQWVQHPYRRPERTTVGVLGLGELGATAAMRLREAGFNVAGWSRSLKQVQGITCRAGEDGLEETLKTSDILVCLLPLTAETRDLLDARRLALLPRGAKLVNFARGPIINTPALLAALDTGALGHAVLDVFAVEPLPAASPEWSHSAVTVLPHISAATDPDTASLIVARNIEAYRADGSLPTAVNLHRGY